MQTLILLRHGKAEPWSDGIADHDRALTELGKRDARRIAEYLEADKRALRLALVSTSRRTRETWQEMRDLFPAADTEILDDLYLAPPEMLKAAIERNNDAATVLVIGHNPGLHDLAISLLRGGIAHDRDAEKRLYNGFATACGAIFEKTEAGNWSLKTCLEP